MMMMMMMISLVTVSLCH